MARFRRRRSYGARSYTRYITARRGRRGGGGIRGMLSGSVGNVIDGALVGVAQQIIPDDFLGGYADPVAMLGVGIFRRNQTLQTLGGYQLGAKLAANFIGPKPVTGGSRGVF